MPIMISLIAPPLYVMTTNALQESEGIAVLTRAIEKLNETIKEYGGLSLIHISEPTRH